MSLFIKKHISLGFKNPQEIVRAYKSLQIDYPKFFKMDNLSKMLLVATEQLLSDTKERFIRRDDVAVIMFNSSSSLEIDNSYNSTITDNNYFPSPSLFVYTLPNICASEVAIRNNFCGELSFYVMKNLNIRDIARITQNTFKANKLAFAVVGWVESYQDIFEVKIALITDNY